MFILVTGGGSESLNLPKILQMKLGGKMLGRCDDETI